MINYTNKLGINDNHVLNRIIIQKHRAGQDALNACKKYIVEDYRKYIKYSDRLQDISPDLRISEESKKELRDTYDSNPKDLQITKNKIKSGLPVILKAKCPYCLISAHNTFDHYLDKAEYPEYSLFAKNLIPACSECNSYKHTFLLDSSGNRMFIHFIYDVLPDYPFLKYRMAVDNNKIILESIALEFQNNDSRKSLIENHFEKLHLYERLTDEFDATISTIIEEFRETPSDYQNTKRTLEGRVRAYERTRGINNWETCILRAIVESDELLLFLSSAALIT